MTGIQFDQSAMNQIVSKAIIESISTEQRDLVIQAAVDSLLAVPKKASYYDNEPKTPIQSAFDVAIEQSARQLAHEYVANNQELKAKLEALLAECAQLLLGDQDSDAGRKLRQGVGSALANAMMAADR